MEKFQELDFIWNITQTISCNNTTKGIMDGLKTIFSNYLNITDVKIYYYNQQQNVFNDFGANNDVSEENELKYCNEIFEKLKSTIRLNFILNDNFFVINDDFYLEHKLKLNTGENVFYIPLTQNYKCIGFIKLVQSYTNNEFVHKNIIKLLFISAAEISSFITTQKLTERISKIANFYKAQKNIAKILETQYDYSFIIPIIGDILDNFTKDYFSYIFMLNENNEFNLSWPLRYDKKRIDPIIEKLPTLNKVLQYEKENIVIFPIYFDGHLKGIILIDGKNKKVAIDDIDLLMQLTNQTATTLDKAEIYAEIEKFATQDALTGLNNRRSLELRINQEIAIAKRKNLPLCVMMLDVDFFKKINDTYGHYVGDIILKSLATVINDEIREYDFPARYGGEEFFIILPSTTIEEAHLVASRLRERVEKEVFDISKANLKTKELHITISVGLSSLNDNIDTKTLYLNVDKALYSAKESGRNKVVIL